MRSSARQKTAHPAWIWSQKWWARTLERLALWVERPVNRFSGTTQLNPFYHTGTIAVFLLAVVALTGFYLFIFFQYGFERSYLSVFRLENQPIGRLMRALHRYASGALVITTFFHAVRMLFMERFRGPRWLAWVTGHGLMALIWGAGVTGYWLIWDGRAQVLTAQAVALLDRLTPWGDAAAAWLISLEAGRASWVFLFLILVVHVLLFLVTAGFFYVHIMRLKRPKWIPEPPMIIGMGVVLLIGALLFPAGMLPSADPGRFPETISFDPIYLFFLPAKGGTGWIIWGFLLGIGLLLAILPWLSRPNYRVSPVEVIEENCTGCTRCAFDCPYDAIAMVPLPAEGVHNYMAVVTPEKCVACGICLGSCIDDALRLGGVDTPRLRQEIQERLAKANANSGSDVELVFTCSRFANQGAKPFLEANYGRIEATHASIEILTVPCAGAVAPDLLVDALEMGAAEVRLIGCPPDDCASREGNLWAEQRLTRERAPRLRKKYAEVPISAVWLPPDQFATALKADVNAAETGWLETRRLLQTLTWKNFVPAFVLLGVILLVQIATSDLSFSPPAGAEGTLEVLLPDLASPLGWSTIGSGPFRGGEVEVWLSVDGQTILLGSVPSADLFTPDAFVFYERIVVAPGWHGLDLWLYHHGTGAHYLLYEDRVQILAGDILRLTDQTSPAGRPAGNAIAR